MIILCFQREYTDEEIFKLLPDVNVMFDIMIITKLLSMRGLNGFGEFDYQYLFDRQDNEYVLE